MFNFVANLYLFLGLITVLYSDNMTPLDKLVSVEFEIHGKVQGVFFRKFTEKEANTIGVCGWCMNTPNNTVKGVIEGTPERVEAMKTWLRDIGSPSSRIDKAIFSNEKVISKRSHSIFKIKR